MIGAPVVKTQFKQTAGKAGGKGPCKFFLAGQCKWGDECYSSHDISGGAAMTGGAVGAGTGGIPCKFHAQGRCAKGAACQFSHSPGGKGKGYQGGFDPMNLIGPMLAAKGLLPGGKSCGKGKGKKGGSLTGGKMHLLPRVRISEAPFGGTVLEWKGKYGWIQPAEEIPHEKAKKHAGRIFVGMDDVLTETKTLEVGATVQYHIWEDDDGLGAEEVEPI